MKFHFITTPTRGEDFLTNYQEGSQDNDWQQKAERLQARRWRKLKSQIERD